MRYLALSYHHTIVRLSKAEPWAGMSSSSEIPPVKMPKSFCRIKSLTITCDNHQKTQTHIHRHTRRDTLSNTDLLLGRAGSLILTRFACKSDKEGRASFHVRAASAYSPNLSLTCTRSYRHTYNPKCVWWCESL